MNSNSEVSDDHIIQIPPDHTPNQSHEQTPIATSTNSPSPKHGSIGVNELTPEELSSLKDLKIHIWRNEWLESKSIIDKCPDMLRFPLNYFGDTALHLAAESFRGEIVNKLVKRMRPEDMRIQNSRGDTALHVAVSEGRGEIVNKLVKRMRPEDMLIPNSRGYTALHVAAREGSLEIVKELVKRMRPEDIPKQNSSGDTVLHLAVSEGYMAGIVKELVKRMRPEDMLIPNLSGDTAFHVAIRLHRFDLATLLFEKHPTNLAIARNEENLTALHMLARKPPKILDMEDERSEGGRLFKKLWTQVNQCEHKRMIMLPVLFDAIKSGNVEAVQWIIEIQPELETIKDPENGRNLLHSVVLFRQKIIFDSITRKLKEHIVRAVDNKGNNILHLAAHLPQGEFKELSSLRASIQMQREFEWFEFVEEYVPDDLRTILNHMGKTPIDVFCEEHRKLSEEIKDTAKGIAESGMLVSTLVATVAFAAALTVPGDKTDAWFTVFILTNAVALFASSASLLLFLSNFTSSRFAQSEFVTSLHPSLTFGRSLLIISVVAMVVAFSAASFLIFHHTSKRVPYAVASMGVFPILLSRLFQCNFLDEHLWSRFYRLPNYYRRLQQAEARVTDRVTGRVRDRVIDCVTLRVNRHRHNLNAKNC